MNAPLAFIRRYFVSGLLVWLPILAVIGVLKFLVGILDKTVELMPANYQPHSLFGMDIPGFGVILSIVVIFCTGLLVTNFIGRHLILWWDKLLARIPLVRSIHSAVKQVLETVFSNKGQSFRKVLLVEYPRAGMWSLAFQTGNSCHEMSEHVGQELLPIFIPTTPNPTSGFLMMVPKDQIIELPMSIDEAFKYIVSIGVVQPRCNIRDKNNTSDVPLTPSSPSAKASKSEIT